MVYTSSSRERSSGTRCFGRCSRLVQLSVNPCPFYGVTPNSSIGFGRCAARVRSTATSSSGWRTPSASAALSCPHFLPFLSAMSGLRARLRTNYSVPSAPALRGFAGGRRRSSAASRGGPTVRCGSCGLPTRQRDAPPTQGIPPPSRGGRRAPERPFRWWSANRSRSARLSHAPMRKWRRRIARLKIRADADLLPHCRRQLHDERAIGLR
jgi:hypothetical protein